MPLPLPLWEPAVPVGRAAVPVPVPVGAHPWCAWCLWKPVPVGTGAACVPVGLTLAEDVVGAGSGRPPGSVGRGRCGAGRTVFIVRVEWEENGIYLFFCVFFWISRWIIQIC